MYEESEPEFQRTSGDSNPTIAPKPAATLKPDRKCSYCGQPFVSAQVECLPFCSRRCQQIDLGMWLNESYGLPYEGDELDVRPPDDEE